MTCWWKAPILARSPYVDTKVANNVNRQIVSTQNGLMGTTRPFALKLRSDMLMTGTGFLDYFNRFPVRSEWSVLNCKVVASTMFSRVPGLLFQWPYHPGDWFFFGRTEDVRNLWDIQLAPEPDTTLWFIDRPRPPNDVGPASMNRYAPEQYVWLSFLRKHLRVRCDYQWDLDAETVAGTEKSFAGNLVLVSPVQANLAFGKYRQVTGLSTWVWGTGGCYTHDHWRYLYYKHCGLRIYPRSRLALLRVPAVRIAARSLQSIARLRAWGCPAFPAGQPRRAIASHSLPRYLRKGDRRSFFKAKQ